MKYIIDVSDEAIELMGGHITIFVEPVFKTGDCKRYALRLSKEDIKPYTEPNRNAIEDAQEEAWEFAKQVTIMTPDDKCELWGTSKYNTINLGYSYAEAKAKYEEWQKQNEEIKVGDEVKENTGLWTGVVVGFDKFDDLVIMDSSGNSCCGYKTKYFRKTGRHFDEVEALLKKMRDES